MIQTESEKNIEMNPPIPGNMQVCVGGWVFVGVLKDHYSIGSNIGLFSFNQTQM